MKLESLRVLHLPKGQRKIINLELADSDKKTSNQLGFNPGLPSQGFFSEGFFTEGFFIDTCQRSVWISQDLPSQSELPEDSELFRGREAYRFLLKWAVGLKSEVLGETDIFGQIKAAWRKREAIGDYFAMELAPWIQRLFEDVKEIRTQYVQNWGGSSYGTLVRKWVNQNHGGAHGNNHAAQGPIFLVGAGQIAESIAPVLLDSELWLWNRDPVRLASFYKDLSERFPHARLKCVVTPEQEEEAWKSAAHIVVCIPVDEETDRQRIQWATQSESSGSETTRRNIIHLGCRKQESQSWNVLPGFACLDDLFALQSTLSQVRSVQVSQADRACEERAQLRTLGVSLSIPHGWEDLACFA